MKTGKVSEIYDEEYASTYNLRWILQGRWKHDADFEEQILGDLLDRRATRRSDPRWLDVACGTGYFLERFPGVRRAGIDISPAMLARARQANPDALFLEEKNFLDPVSEWIGAWDVVSCMWWAHTYVGTVTEAEQLITNLSDWTSPTGTCFMPFCDIEDLTGVPDKKLTIPYFRPDIYNSERGVPVGDVHITGFTWNWSDTPGNRFHKDLLTLHREHLVALFSARFERVDVIRYPSYRGEWNTRKAILATQRRSDLVTRPAIRPDPSGPRRSTREVMQRRRRYWKRRISKGLRRRIGRIPVLRWVLR